MKILAVFVLAISLAAQQTPSGPASSEAQANQQKARAILEQAIQALGGQAYLHVQDFKEEGRAGSFYHGQSSGRESLYFRTWLWPDKERIEYTKQRDIAVVYNGDNAYEITFRGTRLLDPAKEDNIRLYLLRRSHSLETILRQWLQDTGTALFYEGTNLVENHQVDTVTLMNAKNDAVTLQLDAATHLPVKKSFTIRDPQTRERDEISEVYDNWKQVQGIMAPYNLTLLKNGELTYQRFISAISFNTHPSENIFAPLVNFDRTRK